MAMEKIGDGLKKLLLVGIGAAAVTVEKSQQIVEDLVKKGEITVEQGKELNKELQHNVKKSWDARKADASYFEEKISKMGADELEALKKAIHDVENAATETITGLTEEQINAAKAEAGVLRSIFNSYLKLKREVQELRSENRSLRGSNWHLSEQLSILRQDNQELHHDLRETTRDLDRAKKVLGKDAVDQAIATAREQEAASKKNRRRSQEFSR